MRLSGSRAIIKVYCYFHSYGSVTIFPGVSNWPRAGRFSTVLPWTS